MSEDRVQNTIQENTIFSQLNQSQIDFLADKGHIRYYPKGTSIFKKGQENATTFCLVLSGSLDILSDSNEKIRTLHRPDIIGEIGPISPKHTRTCDVIAAEPTELLEWEMDTVLSEIPEIRKSLENLAWSRIVDGDQM